jgi:hypothetical protein
MKLRFMSLVRECYDARAKAQSIVAIETALRDMDAMVTALDRYVGVEEVRTRITDAKHVAYATAAIAARIRSDNLKKLSSTSKPNCSSRLRITTATLAAQSVPVSPRSDAGKRHELIAKSVAHRRRWPHLNHQSPTPSPPRQALHRQQRPAPRLPPNKAARKCSSPKMRDALRVQFVCASSLKSVLCLPKFAVLPFNFRNLPSDCIVF